MGRSLTGIAAITALLSLAGGQPVAAAQLKVAPVRVTLGAQSRVDVVQIENMSDEATRISLRLFDWSQPGGKDHLTSTREVLANPSMFELPPGGRQLVRVGLHAAPGEIERSYRMLIEEVPSAASPAPGQIRTLLRISVPVFVEAPKAQGRLQWRARSAGAGQLAVSMTNSGSAHVQIRDLAVSSAPDGTPIGRNSQMVYVLPGATRDTLLPVSRVVAAGDSLLVTARTGNKDLRAEIVVEAQAHADAGE